MGKTFGSLATVGKSREEYQCAVNGKTVCTCNIFVLFLNQYNKQNYDYS